MQMLLEYFASFHTISNSLNCNGIYLNKEKPWIRKIFFKLVSLSVVNTTTRRYKHCSRPLHCLLIVSLVVSFGLMGFKASPFK